VTATLCLPFQDNYIAEDSIAPFLNSIPAAVDANATLGDTCNVAYVTTWLAGWGGRATDVREMGGTGDTAIRCRVVNKTSFTVFIPRQRRPPERDLRRLYGTSTVSGHGQGRWRGDNPVYPNAILNKTNTMRCRHTSGPMSMRRISTAKQKPAAAHAPDKAKDGN
jgi:hypothetical protein